VALNPLEFLISASRLTTQVRRPKAVLRRWREGAGRVSLAVRVSGRSRSLASPARSGRYRPHEAAVGCLRMIVRT